jgi:hypothetical protein
MHGKGIVCQTKLFMNYPEFSNSVFWCAGVVKHQLKQNGSFRHLVRNDLTLQILNAGAQHGDGRERTADGNQTA